MAKKKSLDKETNQNMKEIFVYGLKAMLVGFGLLLQVIIYLSNFLLKINKKAVIWTKSLESNKTPKVRARKATSVVAV